MEKCVVLALLINLAKSQCPVEYSNFNGKLIKWESKADGLIVSSPCCLDNKGKFILRECLNGSWFPSEPPDCAKIKKFSCPENQIEHDHSCLLFTPKTTFDDPCPYPGIKFYDYEKINTSASFWLPLRKTKSKYVLTSIGKRYGTEVNLHNANESNACFVKTPLTVYESDCKNLHHHICMFNRNQYLWRRHDLRLVMKFDKRKQKISLSVYSPQALATIKGEYAIYCFSDAFKEMKKRVKLEESYNTLKKKKRRYVEDYILYKIKVEHNHAGQYWCEAFNQYEEKVKSNVVIGYKNKKGNEYALKVLLKDFCTNCSWIETKSVHDFLNAHNFKEIFKGLDFILRVMSIKDGIDLEVLLHISTLNKANLMGEYHRILRHLQHQMPPEIVLLEFRSCEFCLPQTTSVNWKLTPVGSKTTPSEICVDNRGIPVFRKCNGDFMEGAYWGDHQNCSQYKIAAITSKLYNLARNITKNASEKIKNITAGAILKSLDIHLVATALNNLTVDDDNLINVVDSVENILENDAEVLKESQVQLNATDQILDTLDKFLNEANVDNETLVIKKDQVIIHKTRPFESNITGVALYGSDIINIYSNQTFNDLILDDLVLAYYVPTQILQNLNDTNITLVTTIFLNDYLFNQVNDENVNTTGSVISISIPEAGSFLEEPIPIIFLNSEENSTQCSFWDYGMDSPNQTGFWSNSGGSLLPSNESYSQCAFNHLTHFALLIMSQRLLIEEDAPYELEDFSYEQIYDNQTVLNVITITGCSLSLLGILGIFITAIRFRNWRHRAGNKILLQLSIAILLEIVIIHVADLVHNGLACNLVGALLHYTVLSKFCWMFVSAILQYIRFVKVLSVLPPHLVLKTMAFGWCAPLAPVILVAICVPTNYSLGSQHFCYPTGFGLYLGLFLPVVLIILANIIVFVMIMRNVLTSRVETQSKPPKQSQKLQMYLAVLLFFMLGIPWIFGILAEITQSVLQLIFMYLFCLTATLQGCVLFVFYVLLNEETRKLWQTTYRSIKM